VKNWKINLLGPPGPCSIEDHEKVRIRCEGERAIGGHSCRDRAPEHRMQFGTIEVAMVTLDATTRRAGNGRSSAACGGSAAARARQRAIRNSV
jgi:hypothetical protein